MIQLKSGLLINDSLRKELSRPFGTVMSTAEFVRNVGKDEHIYAVGDVTLYELLMNGYRPKLGVFDCRTGRGKVRFPAIAEVYTHPVIVRNRRGHLSVALWNAVKKAAANRDGHSSIRVYGEEDLASLACIYFAKNGDIVAYGLRNKGIAVIRVDNKIKAYVEGVLKRMSSVA